MKPAASNLVDVPCNLCGGEDAVVIFPATDKLNCTLDTFACTSPGHGEHYRVVRCTQCGLRFSSPRPDAAALQAEYEQVADPLYERELGGRLTTFRRNLELVETFCKTGTILDIGTGMGAFLYLAKLNGWNVNGIEPSRWSAKKAEELYGLKINSGSYGLAPDFHAQLDVVTMWDVIEHVSDPLEALQVCNHVLKPGGTLVLSTVDAGSAYARLLGKYWPWLMKMHLYYFDRCTMTEYLRKAGFQLLQVRTYRHTISGHYLAYKLRAIGGFWGRAGAYLLGMQILSGRYLTFALGDFMEVVAQKPNKIQ